MSLYWVQTYSRRLQHIHKGNITAIIRPAIIIINIKVTLVSLH